MQVVVLPNIPPRTPTDFLTDAVWTEDPKNVGGVLKTVSVKDINTRDRYGVLPLSLAVIKKNMNIVRLLVEHGANPAALDADARTPINWASKEGNEEAHEYLAGVVAARRRAVADAEQAVVEEVRRDVVADAHARLRAAAARRPKARFKP